MADDQGRELGWDDTIENDSSDWTLLPAGEYPFRVTGFKRLRFEGSAKLPPCNIAVVTLDVGDADVSSNMEHRLFMHSKCEGFLCAFFKSIGQRQHGQKISMDWGKVVGSTGRCKLGVRTWKGKDGSDHESNEIKSFIDPVAPETAAKVAAGELPF
jgi:hypothetical protein